MELNKHTKHDIVKCGDGGTYQGISKQNMR
jgi:hypothetical protein